MRTTLTLDADVAIALDRVRDARELTLKAAVNEALRRGLRAIESELEGEPEAPYRIEPWASGGARVALDSVADALSWGEGEAWR